MHQIGSFERTESGDKSPTAHQISKTEYEEGHDSGLVLKM
jgi:hypothetical protein